MNRDLFLFLLVKITLPLILGINKLNAAAISSFRISVVLFWGLFLSLTLILLFSYYLIYLKIFLLIGFCYEQHPHFHRVVPAPRRLLI